ncbi:hypothetical protein [Streptomyces noursei]|uniref:hypothetical protein n=1 Tax=Streptomyces noursei TaxID=1971 RepID=UPI0015E09BE4|nr:hypothetical protein [Streptomyces noursei]
MLELPAHHIESAPEYVESTVGELKPGESTDLIGGALQQVSIEIKADGGPEGDEE